MLVMLQNELFYAYSVLYVYHLNTSSLSGGPLGRDHMVVQSVPITTKVVSSNPVHGEVYSIQHYVIKFDSDLQQVGGFPRVL